MKLSGRHTVAQMTWSTNADDVDLIKSLLGTMQNAHDRVHIDGPAAAARTIFVDTTGFSATDFMLSAADKLTLFNNGFKSGNKFLAGWNRQEWLNGRHQRPVGT